MVYEGILEGKYVDLKSCTEEDAEFTLAIRNDPAFSGCLPEIHNTVEEQINWIREQRKREGDYFFVVWDKTGKRIGTISIYNIHGSRAESGRLAIRSDNPFHALEAQMLSFHLAFDILELDCTSGFIFADNNKAIRFNKLFAGRHLPPQIDENGREIIPIENWRDDYRVAEKRLRAMLYR